MEAYETLGILGEGTYGVVMKARNRSTGKLVAIKRFKQTDEDEHVRKTSTREVRMLQQLKHPNVVRLEDVFRREGKLYLVFEFIDRNILQVLESSTCGIPPNDLRRFMYQLLRGVEFCHAHNVIHRDVKPENVLIDQSGMLKLCDFGFARQITSKGKYTDYVATRWYRAPELLVGDVAYGKPVDVWALGCMFAELSDGQPLFPGESDLDQLCLIIQTCGPVPDRMVSIFEHNTLYRNVTYPHTGIVYTLQERYHRQPEDWLDFLYSCLHPDPAKRLTCTELMSLPYFTRDGFREKYEQELRAISGLPLLRAASNASAPAHSLTWQAATEKTAWPKNTHEPVVPATTTAAGIPTTVSGAATTTTAALDTPPPPPTKRMTASVQKEVDGIGKCNSMEVLRTKESESGFLPAMVAPASVPAEAPVQLPMILSQMAQKATVVTVGDASGLGVMAGAGAGVAATPAPVEDIPQPPSPHRRQAAPTVSPDTVAPPFSMSDYGGEPHKTKPHRGEQISRPSSAMLSSKRSSLTSLAGSPVKKTGHIAIGSNYRNSHRRPSEIADRVEADGCTGPAAEAVSRHTSRSLCSNASPRSSSLPSEQGGGDHAPFTAAAPSTSASTQSTMTATNGTAAGEGRMLLAAEQPYPISLAERLPDLTSPKLHRAAHHARGGTEAEDIHKPPSQAAYPNSPTSNASAVSHPSLNPLAAPLSRERKATKNAAAAIAKTRRSGANQNEASDVPHTYAKKKLTKRRKEGAVAHHGSCGSSSQSMSRCSLHDSVMEALRLRSVKGLPHHEGTKQGSASVSALKMSISRTSSHARDCLTSQDLRGKDALERTLDEERANRTRGNVSGRNTPGPAARVKHGVDTRRTMLRKERRSKPLHANSPLPQPLESTSRPSPQPQQCLNTFLHPDDNDVAQRALATLPALSALRESTGSNHQTPPLSHDGGHAEKGAYGHMTAGGSTGVDYEVPTPPRTQTKDGPSAPPSKTARSRKPLEVCSLQSTRRLLDEGEGRGSHTTAPHGHNLSTLASIPSSHFGGFAVPYRRTFKAESNGGGGPVPSSTLTGQPQGPIKKTRKKRNSTSGDVGGGGAAMLYALPHRKEVPAPPMLTANATAVPMDKSTPRRQESGGGSTKLLPLVYSTATAAATQM